MSIQLDLTTALPCQNFDSAQGYITLQDHQVIDVDDNIATLFGYDDRESLLKSVDFVYSMVPESYHGALRERYLTAIKGQLQKGKLYKDVPINGRTLSLFSLAHVIKPNDRPALRVMIIDITSVVASERKHQEIKIFLLFSSSSLLCATPIFSANAAGKHVRQRALYRPIRLL